ncbi:MULTISPECIES: hypothetical protein [Streptomyces]|uniref:Uncharacterized protein n=1 Tax=Streptomyces tsukubensis (strain DSM 42081 / NBRC 108919 / NRRL 18488 / 9993) TaxID=1114943 RepID=I2N0F3_STRT9|nr:MULTISPECIES: hypothetical protein [Streptomyces]EIF90500.1 hypothetical protein [Streptomyces tsukubensis NRRL18488]MYS63905.1 hypothetical protein [Streptomyces sp. SID5473]QKM69206.1 hypothetical protein STSU_020595 [Streptomyces tsukubensis NRRL18488]TAI42863.1 hypothetical protein EWI31_20940 [Streptomyces tsukubensis]
MPAAHVITPTLTPTPQSQLDALIRAGGFWGLAPDWVPRGGYACDRGTLVAALAALRRLAQNEAIRLRRGRSHVH